jgi:hypothetical protein
LLLPTEVQTNASRTIATNAHADAVASPNGDANGALPDTSTRNVFARLDAPVNARDYASYIAFDSIKTTRPMLRRT